MDTEELFKALDTLWGGDDWREVDQDSLEECLFQSDDTFMDKGFNVIAEAYRLARKLPS